MLLWAIADVRSHLRPRWLRRTINHNASHSTKTACRTRSRAGRLLALRSCSDHWSDSTVDSWALLLFWAFIHFEGNWACLVATGSHRYRGQSAQPAQLQSLAIGGRRTKKREKWKHIFSGSARTAVKVPGAYRGSPDPLFLAVSCSFRACSGQKSLG